MKIADLLKAMHANGATTDAMIAAVEAFEAISGAEQAERRAKAAAKKAKQRARLKVECPPMSPDVPGTIGDIGGQEGTKSTSPAPSPDGRPSPPAPPHPTLNPSPTPDSQTGASALGDEGAGQVEPVETFDLKTDSTAESDRLDLGSESARANPANPKAKADKPRLNDWPDDYREQFWKVYPRKVAKKPAMKELDRIYKADNVPFFDLINGVKLLVRLDLDPEFIKHPDSWLRNERWNDDQTSRLNRKTTSTNIQKPMTLAAENTKWWLDQSRAAHEVIQERDNGRRYDDEGARATLDGERSGDPDRRRAEPRPGERPGPGRVDPAGRRCDGPESAHYGESTRIPGW